MKLPPVTAEGRRATFATERRRLVLTRLRWSSGLALLPLAISAIANYFVFFDDRLWEHLATHAVQAAFCLLVLLLAWDRHAERFAIPLAAMLAIGLGTTLFWSLSLVPRDLDVLVGPLAIVMVAPTLCFPWGTTAQLAVSLYVAIGYVVFLLPHAELGAARLTNVLITLTLGVATSVIGAWVIDRQRRATFAQRVGAEALAHQRELLLDAGRELNGTLEMPEVVRLITNLGHRLVGSDSASLTLLDPARRVLRTVAVSGERRAHHDDILGVEFSADAAPLLLEELSRRGVLEIPSGTPFDGLQPMIQENFGFARTVYVTIQRDGTLLGFLNFSQRSLEPPFEDGQLRLAEGLAHQAAIALTNARLVDDLQTANRVKSEFVSTMSHELRTPLHVIMGYAEMLEEAPPAEQQPMIAKVRLAGRELLDLIEATLNLNRLEAGRDEPSLEPVDVAALWDELASEFTAVPHKSEVALRWAPVQGIVLATDRRKLKIILKNLVGNALKFTATGEVAMASTADGEQCIFTVSDTGCGIPAEQLPLIFEMFRQVDSSDTRSFGGVGLGLYIVRRLVDQLGGRISVDSAPGQGSTFRVALPAMAAAPESARAAG